MGRNIIIPERLLFELYSKLVLKRTSGVDEEYIRSELTKKFNSNLRRMDYGAMIERKRKEKELPD